MKYKRKRQSFIRLLSGTKKLSQTKLLSLLNSKVKTGKTIKVQICKSGGSRKKKSTKRKKSKGNSNSNSKSKLPNRFKLFQDVLPQGISKVQPLLSIDEQKNKINNNKIGDRLYALKKDITSSINAADKAGVGTVAYNHLVNHTVQTGWDKGLHKNFIYQWLDDSPNEFNYADSTYADHIESATQAGYDFFNNNVRNISNNINNIPNSGISNASGRAVSNN